MRMQTEDHTATSPESSAGFLDLVDLLQYPIHRPDDPRLRRAITNARNGLRLDGCARIGGFIRPALHGVLAKETDDLASNARFSTKPYTPYGVPADEAFPAGHPCCREYRSTSGNVTRDQIPEDTHIHRLFRNDHFKAFIAACVEADVVHEFADPVRGLTINTMPEGSSLGWHFDANEFVVSLMTRRAEAGGTFEYCPGIRVPGNENYEAVQAVLDGDRGGVRCIDLRVGDLQIFKGRYSLHRVTQVRGVRHTVLFGYTREPGVIGNQLSTWHVYGQVLPAHVGAETPRHDDGLKD